MVAKYNIDILNDKIQECKKLLPKNTKKQKDTFIWEAILGFEKIYEE